VFVISFMLFLNRDCWMDRHFTVVGTDGVFVIDTLDCT